MDCFKTNGRGTNDGKRLKRLIHKRTNEERTTKDGENVGFVAKEGSS
ncbi:hypothetical protein MKX62_24415 [Sporosarcina sp. FSL K6-5500]